MFKIMYCLNVLQQTSTIFTTKKHSTLGGWVVAVGESEASIENNEESKIKNKIVKAEEGN